MDSIGKKGKKALAIRIEKTFPKFELRVILIYFIMLTKTRRPSCTPTSSTSRLFSSRIIVLASLVISAAVSTEIPTSAVLKEGASRSEEHTSELQSPLKLVCRLLLEKKKT